ncbi:type II toxin-antitoxin system PemK/MazF family toxin [Thiotrichales bacterium 19S9-12]|nr:type II toxin-antitoxin system PemK/MazF family toxin [Thiotrichales bacterium 19S9-11]MCF6811697.1 type II toxin-antitoxin system PemK/MazF family toxin [Thiotrichales bacterium 19S9-12]
MKRGEIYYANLDPTIGDETKKSRPVLIVSNNANNKMSSTLTVIPITSNTKKVYPFEVLLKMEDSGLPKHSKAQCHQIRTISKKRIKIQKPIGKLINDIMQHVQVSLAIHLDLK